MLYWDYMTASTGIDRRVLNNFLKEKEIKLSYTVKQYLHCLVLEHVANKKLDGTLIADVSFNDLTIGYKLFLYDHFLDKAKAIEEPELGGNGVF